MLDLRLSDKQFDLSDGSLGLALRDAALTFSGLLGRTLGEDMRHRGDSR